MMDDGVRDQLAAYALGALDPAERDAVEARLVASPELLAQLADFQSVAGLLPLAAEEVEAPDRLKASIMARAWSDLAEPQKAESRGPRWWGGVLTGGARRVAFATLALAASVVIVALAVWNVQLSATNDDLRDGLQIARAAGTLSAPDATGAVIYLADEGLTVFTASSLPPLEEGAVYQMWLIADGVPVSAGVLETESGATEAIATVQGDTASFDAFAVSIEQARGAAQPAGAIVLLADL